MPGASSQHRGGADGDQFRSLGSLPSAAGFRTFTTPRNNKVATAGKAPCTRGRLSQAAAAKKQGDKQTKRILLFCLRLFSLGGKYRPGLVEVHVLHHLLHALPDLFAFLCRGVVGCVEGKRGEEDVNPSTPRRKIEGDVTYVCAVLRQRAGRSGTVDSCCVIKMRLPCTPPGMR